MKKQAVLLLTFCLLSFHAVAEENYLHHSIQATVLVADIESATDDLARWADEAGGYLLFKSSDAVTFRFPYTQVRELRAFLEDTSETVVELSLQAQDLREDILGIQSSIQSREEILKENLEYIDQTDVNGTLAIEREVMKLLVEIEQLKGRLRKLNVDRSYALARVNLRIMSRRLPEDTPSSFAWINTIDFYVFMDEGF